MELEARAVSNPRGEKKKQCLLTATLAKAKLKLPFLKKSVKDFGGSRNGSSAICL